MPKASTVQVCDARDDAILPAAGHQKKDYRILLLLIQVLLMIIRNNNKGCPRAAFVVMR
jgi:hypothetical protein